MGSLSTPDQHAEQLMARFQRIAARAAGAGFAASTMLGVLKLTMDRIAPGSAHLRASFDAICALLWPSAMLLLGAQTPRGQAVLFVMSACLNAGYFVFGATLIAGLLERLRASDQVVVHARVPARAYSSPRVSVRRTTSTSSLA